MSDISIIIPVYNEEKYIGYCLDSILNADIGELKTEVLLIDGGSRDRTLEIIELYKDQAPFIVRLFSNPQQLTPISMNIGIENARGKFLFIISAHAAYDRNYFQALYRRALELNADCVGPTLITEVRKRTPTSLSICHVLSDRLGVGSRFRSGTDKLQEVDTVPFGCYRREVFDKIGLYDERLIRNQDIELNKRLKRAGGKIWLDPNVKAIYYARETYKDLAKNNFDNGKWNILTAYYTKTFSSLSLRHFIPLIFLMSLIIPLFCCQTVSFILLAIYLSIITFRSLQIKGETTLLHQVMAFLVLHFSYAFGEAAGIMQVIKMIIKGKR